jgi:hypothetical protein
MRDTFGGYLGALFLVFAPLSLMSFGGSNSVIARHCPAIGRSAALDQRA